MNNPSIKNHGEAKGLDLEDVASMPSKGPLGGIVFNTMLGRPAVNTSNVYVNPVYKPLAYLEDITTGNSGADGLSFISGIGVPAAGLGKNDDTYLNLSNGDIHKKANGVWSAVSNVVASGSNSVVNYAWGMIGVQSGTTTITSKDTVPLVTEGTELWRKIHTARATGNRIIVEFNCVTDCSRRNGKIFFVLFRDNVVVDFGAHTSGNGTGGSPGSFTFRHIATLQDTSPHTYTMRVGTEAATSWFIGRGIDKTMGNINEAYWSIREEKA